ncbi:MAG: ABC transporter substrate-binding protein [Acidimicrobiaceae bacterium]|nr:ABC transporter substrate-binding protein [Acidimicrobiaceae bacterium]
MRDRALVRRALPWALVILALVAGACSDSSDSETATVAVDAVPEPAPDRPGGEIVLAVEQWPECLNPITSCNNATWLSWSVLVHVRPRLMEFDINNNIGASPVLVEAPSVDNGGAVLNDDGTLTITYRLNPEARWSDDTPITSTDVWFTWRAIIDTEGSLNTTGYDLITDVGHDDPQTAVVTLLEPYAALA